jgi:hypothetical protein
VKTSNFKKIKNIKTTIKKEKEVFNL